MLYFSELHNNKVHTKDGIYLGRLKDVIFLASENPSVTKIVIKTLSDPELIVPVEDVRKINGGVTLEKSYNISKLKENELFLTKNLLDNQIIDISGDKIVRVNDVAINDKPTLSIAGVDIGLIGILRWFGLEDIFIKIFKKIGIKLRSRFLSWADIQTLELTRGHVKIKKEQTKLDRIRPEDLADYLEETNVANARGILKILDEKNAVEVINNLNPNYQTALFKQFESDQAAKIISVMDPEEAVDVLLSLSKKKREKILDQLSDASYKEIKYLLDLPDTPIAQIVTTEFLTVESDATVKEVKNLVRAKTGEFYNLSYIYVVNQDKQLIGVFDLHEMLLQHSDTQVYKFMTQKLATIHLNTPMTVAFRKIIKYKLYALPVVDRDKQIVGIVVYDDIIDLHLKNNE